MAPFSGSFCADMFICCPVIRVADAFYTCAGFELLFCPCPGIVVTYFGYVSILSGPCFMAFWLKVRTPGSCIPRVGVLCGGVIRFSACVKLHFRACAFCQILVPGIAVVRLVVVPTMQF